MAEMIEIASMTNAELSLALRELGKAIANEAGQRLARIAATQDGHPAIAVQSRRVAFPRHLPMQVSLERGRPTLPTRIDECVVDGLEQDEYRAVDIFGELWIIHRVADTRAGAS